MPPGMSRKAEKKIEHDQQGTRNRNYYVMRQNRAKKKTLTVSR